MTSDAASCKLFEERLLGYVNGHLLPAGAGRVDATTPLFEHGRLNSMRLLHLLAWVEKTIGREIPEEEIVMDRFSSVRVIAERFAADG